MVHVVRYTAATIKPASDLPSAIGTIAMIWFTTAKNWHRGDVEERKKEDWMAHDLDTKIPLSRAGSHTSQIRGSIENGLVAAAARGSSESAGGLI